MNTNTFLIQITIYEQFIEYLKKEEKNFDLSKNYEKHHILPLHDGGSETGPVVLCTAKNHTLAHYYRFLTYGQKGDFVAFTMRWNQKIGATERALLAVEANKKLKNTFWNSQWQSKQGKKGGRKGGAKKTLKQYEARQNIGLTYGKTTGMKNASFELKTFLSKEVIWVYQMKNKSARTFVIDPQQSLSDVVLILNRFPFIQKKINLSSFYKVIYGERRQMYGWSIFFIKL